MRFSELVEKISSAATGSHFLGNLPDPTIQGVAAVDQAVSGALSYIEGGRFASHIQKTQASALIVPKDVALQAQATERGIAWIEATNPRLVFAQAIALFYQPFKPAPAIHPTAVIDPSAQIGQDVAVEAHVVIQANAKIGDNVCIHPNVVLYPETQVGDRTILHANCVIHERSHIGADCVIHSGAVIGAEGFGFVPIAEGWYKMQQSGYVVLEDGVEIGCNSAVDRPAVGETRIARNTKIDNLVQVGHGCQIGQNCAIAAQVGLAGGSKIGNRVILAGQVGVANQAEVGDGVTAATRAGIHSNVGAGKTVSGYPAIPHSVFLKAATIYARLPEMYRTLKQIQRRLGESSLEGSLPDDRVE